MPALSWPPDPASHRWHARFLAGRAGVPSRSARATRHLPAELVYPVLTPAAPVISQTGIAGGVRLGAAEVREGGAWQGGLLSRRIQRRRGRSPSRFFSCERCPRVVGRVLGLFRGFGAEVTGRCMVWLDGRVVALFRLCIHSRLPWRVGRWCCFVGVCRSGFRRSQVSSSPSAMIGVR